MIHEALRRELLDAVLACPDWSAAPQGPCRVLTEFYGGSEHHPIERDGMRAALSAALNTEGQDG